MCYIIVIDGEGWLVSFHVVANPDEDGVDFVLCGSQICPNSLYVQPKKEILDSVGLHSDEVTRTILGNVKLNYKRIKLN